MRRCRCGARPERVVAGLGIAAATPRRRAVRMRALMSALVLGLAGAVARAELSGDDYLSTAPAPDARARERIEADLADARRRAAQAAAQEAARLMAEAARRAEADRQRPAGERLLEARCTACHTLAVLDGTARGRLGWRWTVERMRWWHGAPLAPGDAAMIAGWLARTRPAAPSRRLAEWMSAAAVLALVADPALGRLRRGARRIRSLATPSSPTKPAPPRDTGPP